jgi:hypothetical protein
MSKAGVSSLVCAVLFSLCSAVPLKLRSLVRSFSYASRSGEYRQAAGATTPAIRPDGEWLKENPAVGRRRGVTGVKQ